MIFILLDYNQLHKKQKSSALDILVSTIWHNLVTSKEMWSVLHVTCIEIIARASLTR